MSTQKKPPQSDRSPLRLDTSMAERSYVLVNQVTQELGEDLDATPDFADRDNQRRAISGDPWRWVEWKELIA